MKNSITILLLVSLLGCEASDESGLMDETTLLLGAKADQACDHDATTGEDSEQAVTEWEDEDAAVSMDTEESSVSEDAVLEGDTSGEPDAVEEADELAETDPIEELVQDNPCEATDPFAEAYDVNKHLIAIPEGTEPPTYVGGKSDDGVFGMNGSEYWQKWPGGENPLFGYYGGTDAGKLCMHASARRFDAIMNAAPESLRQLVENSNWNGRFFNWNDDYSNSSSSTGYSARLWAWRTTLVKWISQTNGDGTCYLPTLAMVEALASNCADRAANYDGEIQGCTN